MTKPEYTAIKCDCSDKTCANWHVDPVAAVPGVCFTEEQAKMVADVLNMDAEDERTFGKAAGVL